MQIFVQMESISSAQKLLERYSEVSASIRGKSVYFQYSNREEITPPSNQRYQGGGAILMNNGSGEGYQQSQSQNRENANSILLVSILKARVPITLENIYQVFRPYGEVLKIIIFTKDGVFKALVQMGTIDSAINAKIMLEGKDMFQGCCHLQIGFSTLKELTIKSNGPRSRDFTQSGEYSLVQNSTVGIPSHHFVQNDGLGFPNHSSLVQKQFGDYPSNMSNANAIANNPGSVILVSNLPEDKISPDILFILFGVYGDVLRIKILYQKRDSALIQFANSQQAHMAMVHLSHLQFYDKEISISPSRHTTIIMPRNDATPEDENVILTKDFCDSPIHRFKHHNNRNLKNIHPPSQVLHVSHLHDTADEDELRQLFGGDCIVQFFATNRTMAYVKMESVHDAVIALIKTHNYKLKDRYIRVSFSGRDPTSITGSVDIHETLQQ